MEQLEQWFTDALADLQTFAIGLERHPPTLRAVALVLIVSLLALLLSKLTATVVRYLLRPKDTANAFATMFVEQGDDNVVRITRSRLNKLRASYSRIAFGSRVQMTSEVDGEKTSSTARLEARPARGSFDDNSVAMSVPVVRKLGLTELFGGDTREGVPAITQIAPLPWYTPEGIAVRTIFDPDRNVALTWRAGILSVLVSLLISEVYFYREGLRERTFRPPAPVSAGQLDQTSVKIEQTDAVQ